MLEKMVQTPIKKESLQVTMRVFAQFKTG